MENKNPKIVKMKVLITIIECCNEKQLTDMYLEHHIPFHLVTHGLGTADSEMIDYLGLGETRKNLIISIIAETQVDSIFGLLSSKLNFEQPGKGVAFTMPLSCISAVMARLDKNQMAENLVNNEFDKKENIMKMERLYELIVIIVSQGFSDQAMEAARAAGASGGTVVHARGIGSSEAAKFLEISIQPERELILILAKCQDKANIMDRVNQAVGLTTKGKGILFTLPVDDTAGLGL